MRQFIHYKTFPVRMLLYITVHCFTLNNSDLHVEQILTSHNCFMSQFTPRQQK